MLDPIAGGTPGITEVEGLRTKHGGNNVSVDREARLLAVKSMIHSSIDLLR